MAVIQNTYTGDGSTVLFSFTFEYLNDTEVRVSVNGVNTTEFTLVNATTVQMNTAPANGALVRIYRVTDIEEPIVTYNAGSAIRARDLNDNESQLLNAVQELDAYSVFADGSKPLAGDLDANGYQISNLATPTSSTDAANKDYVDSVIATGAANAAAAAVSAADAAASAADAAASFDAFDDRFLGAKASEPSVDNDGNALVTGALYFNTATNIARVYNGSYWENVAQPQSVTRWIKTAAGGETSLSGNDDNTFSLAYKAGAEQIFLNGAHLTRGVDYVATDGTTVTGLAALTAGDVVEVLSVNDYIYGTVPDGSVTNAKVAAGAAIASSKLSFTQAGTGAVARSVDSKLKDVVSVKDFGAVGDGVTDDTAAIQAAIDHCISIGSYLLGSPGTYKISATLNLNCSGDLSAMTVQCPGATVSPAIQVGTTSGAAVTQLKLTLPQVVNSSKSGAGWSGFETSIGVDCGNLYDSAIRIPYIYGFGYNAYVGGHTAGNSYNEYTIGRLQEGKVGLRVAPRSVSGWANENNFYGGKLSKSSSEGTSTITGAYALQLGADPGQAWSCNNNVFFKPAVEGSGADEYQIVLNNTSYNTFVNARFEVTGGTGKVKLSADTLGTCSKNIFIGGYGLSNVVWTADANSVLNNVFGSSGHDVIDGSSSTAASLTLSNSFSSGETAPHITGFPSSGSVPLLNRGNADTSWIYRLHGSGISVKAAAATYPTLRLSQTGRLEFGQGVSDPTTHGAYLTAGNPGQLRSNANFQPSADNTYALGAGSLRWSVVYAVTGTINTSDERQKQDIANLDDAERRVAASLKGLIKKFRYKDAVELKGDDARIHVGVIAQDVIAAFQAEGLDPMRYGIVCYDQWDATDDAPAGDLYGVRYEELLAFIIAAL